MRAHHIIMAAPTFDDDLRLAERVKYLPIQQLMSEPVTETLDVAILPR